MRILPSVKSRLQEFFWIGRKTLLFSWESSPSYTLGVVGSNIVSSAIPAAEIYVGKLIIDGLVAVVSGADAPYLVAYVVLQFFLGLTAHLFSASNRYFLTVLQDKVGQVMELSVLKKTLGLDMAYFDDHKFYDKLTTVEREVSWRPLNLLMSFNNILDSFIRMVSVLGLLLVIGGWIVGLLLVVAVPTLVLGLRYARARYAITDTRSPISKEVNYLTGLITRFAPHEVKFFGIGDYILDRYNRFYGEFIEQTREFSLRRLGYELITAVLAGVVYYGVYLWIIGQAILRAFTVGDVTMYSSAYGTATRSIERLSWDATRVYEHMLFLKSYFDFMKSETRLMKASNPALFTGIAKSGPGIEFKNVWFRYGNKGDWILKNVNLKIPPDTNLAIVGENGAGKTTLIKLLLRYYDPQRGRILVDGKDIKYYDLESYWDKIAALQQNFTHYQLTPRENIGFGRIENIKNTKAIKEAAEKAGAAEFVSGLDKGYNTRLGTWFKDGKELSTGQWQRLALARAFMRGGDILVLDEPTASLDAKAEYEIFKRFIELVKDKIAILISHRFSTVRLADRIIVIEGGKIIEQGSHRQLMKKNGHYASMFNMQAEGYRS